MNKSNVAAVVACGCGILLWAVSTYLLFVGF